MNLSMAMPFPIKQVPIGLALEHLQALRSPTLTPVLVGGLRQLQSLQSRLWDATLDTERLVSRSLTLDGEELLTDNRLPRLHCQRLERLRDDALPQIREDSSRCGRLTTCPAISGCCWTFFSPCHDLNIPLGGQDDAGVQVANIALLPTGRPWEVACDLRFRDPEGRGTSAWHAAVWRHWQERYGAVVSVVTDISVSFEVARPPLTRASALLLAYEHHAYCPSTLNRKVDCIEALAGLLLKASVWMFTWRDRERWVRSELLSDD